MKHLSFLVVFSLCYQMIFKALRIILMLPMTALTEFFHADAKTNIRA